MPALSWNQAGHILVGEIAYELVSLETKNKIDDLILPVFEYKINKVQKYIQDRVPKFSEFAILSILPDRLSRLKLDKYFDWFNAAVPQNMERFSYVNHYINSPYNKDSCVNPKIQNAPYVKDFLMELIASFANLHSSELTKSTTLIFVSHLVADYHQPLHVSGRMDFNCKYDRGGSKFCASPANKKGKCPGKKNLHYIFDSLFLGNDDDIKGAIKKVKEKYPLSHFQKEQVCDLSLESWIEESTKHAPFIYSTTEGELLSSEYKNEAKEILAERLAFASYRLAIMLENIFEGDKSFCDGFTQNPTCFDSHDINDLGCSN